MQRFLGGRLLGAVVSLLVVGGIVLAYRHVLRVNQTTVALSFLLVILAVSAVWGMLVSAIMSVVAMLAFNYYFLPPVRTLTIADPQNWVALLAFLITSITGSRLSSRIRKEADEAHQRRREVERLYGFSRHLLGEGNVIQLMNAIPDYIVENGIHQLDHVAFPQQVPAEAVQPLHFAPALMRFVGLLADARREPAPGNRGNQKRKQRHPILRVGNRERSHGRQKVIVEG